MRSDYRFASRAFLAAALLCAAAAHAASTDVTPFQAGSATYQLSATSSAGTPVQILPTKSDDTTCIQLQFANTGAADVWVSIAQTSALSVPDIPAPGDPGTSQLVKSGQTVVLTSPTRRPYINTQTASGTTTLNVSCGIGAIYGSSSLVGGGSGGTIEVINTPSSDADAAIAPNGATTVNGLVAKSGAGNLYGFTVTNGAAAGYVIAVDATAIPSDGAITPFQGMCYSMPSASSTLGWSTQYPARFGTGITLVYSTTGCATLTKSATATISALVK